MSASGPALHDIHVPPASWWPPAPGWWMLTALLFVVAACVAWWLWRHAQRRPLRTVLREIDAMELACSRDADAARLADRASRLLRRVACRIAPEAASQSGDAWRAFLHGYAHDADTREVLDELADSRFRVHPVLETPRLCNALRTWCRAALRGNAMRRGPEHAPRRQGMTGAAGSA